MLRAGVLTTDGRRYTEMFIKKGSPDMVKGMTVRGIIPLTNIPLTDLG